MATNVSSCVPSCERERAWLTSWQRQCRGGGNVNANAKGDTRRIEEEFGDVEGYVCLFVSFSFLFCLV